MISAGVQHGQEPHGRYYSVQDTPTSEVRPVPRTRENSVRGTEANRSELAADLKNRYDAGESIRSLATSTGRSYGFIHRILTESGVTLRGRGGAARRDQQVRKLPAFVGIGESGRSDISEHVDDLLAEGFGE
jgi:Helix-turn-helix domain